jgi:uncharacterized protein
MQHSNSTQNRLAAETSPYLLQHANNPVNWYPWGDEAWQLARSTGKPVMLSIGYSACHWCHVMAHESFENPATAQVMNELFINIKVDREERPDVDRIYQLALQMLTRTQGGWPLTIFLTPEQAPFFGGTYFPPQANHGLPAFTDLLQRVASVYSQRKDEINNQCKEILDLFKALQSPPHSPDAVFNTELLTQARNNIQQQIDQQFGGFGQNQKFPHPTSWDYLLRYWRGTAHLDNPDLQALYMSTLTLTRMAEGGLYDHLGGGFFRYTVDRQWTIPHFEKMLYDNGSLLGLYAHAAIATGDPLFKYAANQTADWIMRDMQSPQGGYWSALDADSEGHEGKFYVWTRDQLQLALTPDEYSAIATRFGIHGDPNFEGAWHLRSAHTNEDIAALEPNLVTAKQKLLTIRNARIWPTRDEKIIVSWNALAIKGMAIAARTFDRSDLITSAQQAVDFIHTHLWQEGRLLSVYKDGKARFTAYLDDHAFLLDALIELLQTQWRSEDLSFAIQIADALLEKFEDKNLGSFFFTANDAEQLIHRPKQFSDEAMPSGNGVAAYALQRLGYILSEPRYIQAAERTLQAAWRNLNDQPMAFPTMLMSMRDAIDAPQMIVVRGNTDELHNWQQQLNKIYSPQRIVLGIPTAVTSLPEALASKQAATTTIAYVCKGTTCSEPLQSLVALIAVTRD